MRDPRLRGVSDLGSTAIGGNREHSEEEHSGAEIGASLEDHGRVILPSSGAAGGGEAAVVRSGMRGRRAAEVAAAGAHKGLVKTD